MSCLWYGTLWWGGPRGSSFWKTAQDALHSAWVLRKEAQAGRGKKETMTVGENSKSRECSLEEDGPSGADHVASLLGFRKAAEGVRKKLVLRFGSKSLEGRDSQGTMIERKRISSTKKKGNGHRTTSERKLFRHRLTDCWVQRRRSRLCPHC